MPNLIVTAVTKYDGKGLAKGKKDVASFDKSIKKLGKTLLGFYSITKAAQYGKSSVKAFLADEKAAAALARTLDNLGIGFKAAGAENFIANLQKQTGVLDDFLRPAYQKFISVLGSTTLAQNALNVALDVAAGTGQDLSTVSNALSKAYAGNTTALGKLIPGLNKSALASKDLEQINAELTRLFGGQAATAASGYAGQMNQLNVAAAEASETIGKSLVDALILASGSQGMTGLASKVDILAGKIANGIDEIGIFIAYTKKAFSGASIDELNEYARTLRGLNAPAINIPMKGGLQKLAAEKKALELAKKNAVVQKKTNTDLLALKKIGTAFDLAQIQIQAALNYNIDQETRIRLKLQKALLDENVSEAQRLEKALEANQAKTAELAFILRTLPKADDPFADWPTIIAKINGLLKDLKIPGSAAALLGLQGLTVQPNGTVVATPTPSAPINIPATIPTAPTAPISPILTPAAVDAATAVWSAALDSIAAAGDAGFAGAARRAGYVADPPVVNVTVNAGVVGNEQTIADAVQTVIQNLGRYGTSLQYAGAIAI